jgi:hypothetical protein
MVPQTLVAFDKHLFVKYNLCNTKVAIGDITETISTSMPNKFHFQIT